MTSTRIFPARAGRRLHRMPAGMAAVVLVAAPFVGYSIGVLTDEPRSEPVAYQPRTAETTTVPTASPVVSTTVRPLDPILPVTPPSNPAPPVATTGSTTTTEPTTTTTTTTAAVTTTEPTTTTTTVDAVSCDGWNAWNTAYTEWSAEAWAVYETEYAEWSAGFDAEGNPPGPEPVEPDETAWRAEHPEPEGANCGA